ncbi:DUF6527 family protein [Flaviaesturariibacter amylovorans]
MNRLRTILEKEGQARIVAFECPGCGEEHAVHVNGGVMTNKYFWGFNNDFIRPTFTPSVLVRSGHYAKENEGPGLCWCDYEQRFREPAPSRCEVCHSFVTDGRIQFLSDCTHALAGQTVDLPELPQ